MLIISITVFLLQTASLAASFQSILELQEPDPKEFKIYDIIGSVIEYTTLQIVDAILIYRCWIVYSYSWKIICLPTFFWISSVALSSYDIYLAVLRMNTTDRNLSNKLEMLELQIWDVFYTCNIVVNVYATTAIVYRIVRVMRNSINPSSHFYQTWRIIADSGALYTLSTIVNLIATVLLGQDSRFMIFAITVDPINSTMAGIAFSLILIRVGQQRMSQGNQVLSTLRFRVSEVTGPTPSQIIPSTPFSNMDISVHIDNHESQL